MLERKNNIWLVLLVLISLCLACSLDGETNEANKTVNEANVLVQNQDKAIADYSKAIEINPQDAQAHNNRGIAYRAIDKKDLADADEKKAKELGYK